MLGKEQMFLVKKKLIQKTICNMSLIQLSDKGIVNMLIYNGNGAIKYEATVQIVDIKHISHGRYRVVLSDGQHYIQGMLIPLYAELVQKGNIKKFTIIKLQEIAVNTILKKQIVVVILCDIIAQLSYGIGRPTHIAQKNLIRQMAELKIDH